MNGINDGSCFSLYLNFMPDTLIRFKGRKVIVRQPERNRTYLRKEGST